MKKRILSICLVLAMLLSLPLAAFAEETTGTPSTDTPTTDPTTDYDALAVAQGYHARVGDAETAYDEGKFTGYLKFNESANVVNTRDAVLDTEKGFVKEGDVVTLITDAEITGGCKQLLVRGTFTLDGNGHTLTGSYRAADDNSKYYSNVTVKNLNVVAGETSYVAQINAGHKMTFENCTITMNTKPDAALFVVGGELVTKNCTIDYKGGHKASWIGYGEGIRIHSTNAAVTLTDTTINLDANCDDNDRVIDFQAVGSVSLLGKTKINVANPNAIALAVNSTASTVTIAGGIDTSAWKMKLPDEFKFDTISTWDGTTYDTSWYQAGTLEYTLDSAEKVAGLAKLCADKATANFPSAGESSLVTFYITCDIDLNGHEWTPIGNSYNNRFQGNIIGKKGGVEGAAVTIYNMKFRASSPNFGFVGSAADGTTISNLIFVDPVVDGGNQQTVGTVLGYARGDKDGKGIQLSNVHVQNGSLASLGQWSGGLVAYSKYMTITFTNCTYQGNITATAGQMVGGIIGNAAAGAVMTNCYAGGTISSAAKQTGGLIGYLDAGSSATLTDCQMDMLVGGTGESGTGALIGEIATSATATNELKLTRVLVSGVAFEKTTPANAFAIIGLASGSGKVTVTAENTVTAAELARCGKKDATVEGGTSGISTPAFADLTSTDSDKGVALLGGTAYTKGANNYPVLANAKDLVADTYGYADYAWIDPSKTEMTIGTANELVGFSNAAKAWNFAGKTVKLSASIDGSVLPASLTLGTDGAIGALTAKFVGKFDKNGNAISKMTFTTGGEVIITVVWDWNTGNEEDKFSEEYKYGETPSYKGETPTRANDDTYSYKFIGWDKKITAAEEDVVYTAVWKKTKLESGNNDSSDVTTGAKEESTTAAPTATGGSDDGCKSSISGVIAPICMVLCALTVVGVARKRRED